ncbi:YxeA family protein [Lysinibacillus piscis]|uniref:Membrane protein n=1 Tax=Lysinibacillus piscis TaxID=2518931 RepID=A0ABQ5NPB9_9BACI|nr:YxeA family protein [Lysinibacillus sp. KH24]GLC90158.1 membrane protein [Lysinibacillus sp. KH24]
MKKVFIGIGALLVVLVAGLVVLMTVDFNRLNKDAYYVQITADGKVKEDKADNGEIFKTYWYELEAYNENAEEKALTFSAQKNLRQDAYLKLYVKNGTEVTSYDEVQFDELPNKVQQQMKS